MLNLSTKDMAMVGMLSALAVAMGYAFIFVPNIEMVSATIFIASANGKKASDATTQSFAKLSSSPSALPASPAFRAAMKAESSRGKRFWGTDRIEWAIRYGYAPGEVTGP